jgi:hypothetical protein
MASIFEQEFDPLPNGSVIIDDKNARHAVEPVFCSLDEG